MGGKSGGGIVGYRYYLGMHMVVCQGAGALLGITVGGRLFYGGVPGGGPDTSSTGTPVSSLTTNTGIGFSDGVSSTGYTGFSTVGVDTTQDIYIDASSLFGGDTREGGISGTFGAKFGEATMAVDSYLQSVFGAYTPAFRGVFSVILKDMYVGLNPYLKDWAFLVRRSADYYWNTSLAKIQSIDNHYDDNPAHMIRELIWNVDFGMGYSTSQIDDVSFTYAAQTLYNEGFGLCYIWDTQGPVSDVIQKILNHINGVLYVDQSTGLLKLVLLRADYTVSALPFLNESNILELESYQRAMWSETNNEVVVTYTDRFTGNSIPVTVQDLANFQVQGAIVSTSKTYEMISNPDLAYRVAARDLQILSTPLSKIKLKVNRIAWNIRVGDVFVFQWANLGISQLVYRVGEITSGNLQDNSITISAVEDVFGLPATTYSAVSIPDSGLTGISASAMYPVPAVNQRLCEVCYYDLVQRIGSVIANAQPVGASFIMAAVARPALSSGSFQFETTALGVGGVPDGVVTGHYSPSCVLPALGFANTSTMTYSADTDMSLAAVGQYGYIETELVSIAALNTTTKAITLNRGVLDTVPAYHASGSRLYITSVFNGGIQFEYTEGETITGYVLPQFPLGILPYASATPLTLTPAGRPFLPYPPGNLQANGTYYPAAISLSSDLVITWAHRSRTQQTAGIILQTAGNIGPEVGTTYTVQVVNSILGTITTVSGLTGTTCTVTAASIAALIAASAHTDPSYYVGSTITIAVWSTRDGEDSWQHTTIPTTFSA